MSAELRAETRVVRRALKQRTVTPADVLRERPFGVRHMLAYEVLLMTPGISRVKLSEINKDALFAGVNIAVPLERMSEYTQEWLIERVRRVGVKSR